MDAEGGDLKSRHSIAARERTGPAHDARPDTSLADARTRITSGDRTPAGPDTAPADAQTRITGEDIAPESTHGAVESTHGAVESMHGSVESTRGEPATSANAAPASAPVGPAAGAPGAVAPAPGTGSLEPGLLPSVSVTGGLAPELDHAAYAGSPFPPIADYGFLSDCEVTALVAPSGNVEWLCLPRMDSPSVFAAILDRDAGGFRFGPADLTVPAARRYLPGTNVLETSWGTSQGWVIVRDVLLIGPWHHDRSRSSSHRRAPTDYDAHGILLRTIRCVNGEMQLTLDCEPVFDYGRSRGRWEYEGDGYQRVVCRPDGKADSSTAPGGDAASGQATADGRATADGQATADGRATADGHPATDQKATPAGSANGSANGSAENRGRGAEPGLKLTLTGDFNLGIEGSRAIGRSMIKEGESRFCALAWGDVEPPATFQDAYDRLVWTAHHWQHWLARGRFPDHPWRSFLERSALTLKGLTYEPTGAVIAAATTSLPETPGGERNWDYRYSWIRDSTFALWGLYSLGFDWEAQDFLYFVEDAAGGPDDLQVMYGIGGERTLDEYTLDHLHGYEGARPVRVGNGAYNQKQHDVWGAVLDSVYLHTKSRDRLDDRVWPILVRQVEDALTHWREPDRGIWEVRGDPKHFTSSKVMCWVAADRGARLARLKEDRAHADRWQAAADEIKADICANGLDERGVFTQHYDTNALDASVLLMPLVRFLPPDDERIRATVLAIADELTVHGLVLRYRPEETDDGLSGSEGSFTICSFWLVSALVEIGELPRARRLCEKLLSYASSLGLYGEEIEPETGRHMGNFPQAFTHLALINAVMHVIEAERRAQMASMPLSPRSGDRLNKRSNDRLDDRLDRLDGERKTGERKAGGHRSGEDRPLDHNAGERRPG
jgi:GH15 family glucan-1,4-alpha-glucosidase